MMYILILYTLSVLCFLSSEFLPLNGKTRTEIFTAIEGAGIITFLVALYLTFFY